MLSPFRHILPIVALVLATACQVAHADHVIVASAASPRLFESREIYSSNLAQFKQLREEVERVNAAFNRHPYVSSFQNWGEVSHWETPFEFLHKNGQCLDYAIAKFMMLRALGVPNENLRLVVLHDTVRSLEHAVAVVSIGGDALMLDNQMSLVLPVSQVHPYRPYYSTNETGWWLHVPNPLGIEAPVREASNAAQSSNTV